MLRLVQRVDHLERVAPLANPPVVVIRLICARTDAGDEEVTAAHCGGLTIRRQPDEHLDALVKRAATAAENRRGAVPFVTLQCR